MLLKGCLFPTLTERSQLAHARAHTHTHPVNESLVCRVTLSLSLSASPIIILRQEVAVCDFLLRAPCDDLLFKARV